MLHDFTHLHCIITGVHNSLDYQVNSQIAFYNMSKTNTVTIPNLRERRVTEELCLDGSREEESNWICFLFLARRTDKKVTVSIGITKETLLWWITKEEAQCLMHVGSSMWKGIARYLTVVLEETSDKEQCHFSAPKVKWKLSCDSLGHQFHGKYRLFPPAWQYIHSLQNTRFERDGLKTSHGLPNVYQV